MRPPLAVRLENSRTSRHIETELIGDLTFASQVPGGFSTCRLTLARPLTPQPADMGLYTKVTVYDTRDGRPVWDGWMTDPGRGKEPNGALWDVVAEGPAAHADDAPQPMVYIDTRIEPWARADDVTRGATLETRGGIGETPAVLMQFPQGLGVVLNSRVTDRYPHLIGSGQNIGRLRLDFTSGATDANWTAQWVARTAALVGVTAAGLTMTTGNQTLLARRGTEISDARQIADFRLLRSPGGTVTIGSDIVWINVTNLTVMPTLYTSAGAEIVTGYGNDYLTPDQIVNDLLGRVFRLYDPTTISTASAVHIDQLAYESGVTGGGVLRDLMAADPAMYWAAWERTASGKYAFEWKPWPTTPTLRADVSGGFTNPGSGESLINTAYVRWTSAAKGVRWTVYTQNNPTLTAAGRTRSVVVDLGSEAGTQTMADNAGAAALRNGLWPTNNGTLTVTKPIADIATGQLIQPWQLPRLAGRLIKVADVDAPADALNTSDRDGFTTFRLAGASYSARANAATCVLDQYDNTVSAALQRQAVALARLRRP